MIESGSYMSEGEGKGGNSPQEPENPIPPQAENLCTTNPPKVKFAAKGGKIL